MSYDEGYKKQLEVHAEVVSGTRPDTVLLLEHTSVYTAGKRTEMEELPDDGSEFVETNRGERSLGMARGSWWATQSCDCHNQSMS